MVDNKYSRRGLLKAAGVSAGAAAIGFGKEVFAKNDSAEEKKGFGLCLNMATIMGQNLSLIEEIEVAAKAGFDSIEPWIRKIKEHKDKGGSLADVKKLIADKELTVESSIGFAGWIMDDDTKRAQGLEQFKQDMDLVSQIGGKRIAAPPVGATRGDKLDLLQAAKRYRELIELGEQFGIVPQIELWGPSANLHRIGEAMLVVIESGHPEACLMPDFYHIYRGGSDFAGLNQLSGEAIKVFHMNDYPDIPRDKISDKDRVMPGDGICPLPKLLRMMYYNHCRPVLSLEIFNQDWWAKDALETAKVGIAKMKAVVAEALA